ncbi:hypothetical protein [Pseudomonas akapageensis]|uniref:hypothetical protein n=1 Tax=Pseudomonas akapageensis TaxID=2609961 RepID=UPI00140D8AFB|nr:hypothetical protein [Pseudomonas akapageensis]
MSKAPCLTLLALSLLAVSFTTTAHADAHITLGSQERVARLFAYPNNCNVICFRNWTLEQTVEHYLSQSTQRDGYSAAKVKVSRDNDQLVARISGVPQSYEMPVKDLLDAGDLAFEGASRLNRDGKWAYNWNLFLPLGMALEKRRSIELLHFPPDYSLTQAQDYLRSATSDRWASLLTRNGIPREQTPAYQTIIDIAPIAAPASAGKNLEGVYGYFQDYQRQMVKSLSRNADGQTLPMVAFGAPVRDWIKQQYGPTLKVLGLASISLASEQQVTVLGAHHPSNIWYAADRNNHKGDQDRADQAGLKVMGQDLSAACWQAGMGRNHNADPKATLDACTHKWQVTSKKQTCELFFSSIRNMTAAQAKSRCATGPMTRTLRDLQKTSVQPAPGL